MGVESTTKIDGNVTVSKEITTSWQRVGSKMYIYIYIYEVIKPS